MVKLAKVSMVNITNKSNSLFLLAIKGHSLYQTSLHWALFTDQDLYCGLTLYVQLYIHLEETSLCFEISHYNCLNLIQDLESNRIHLCIHYSSFDFLLFICIHPVISLLQFESLHWKYTCSFASGNKKWGYYKSSKILQGELVSMV